MPVLPSYRGKLIIIKNFNLEERKELQKHIPVIFYGEYKILLWWLKKYETDSLGYLLIELALKRKNIVASNILFFFT